MGQILESIPKMTKKGGLVKLRIELDQLLRLAHHVSDTSDNIHILYYHKLYTVYITFYDSSDETELWFNIPGVPD